MKLIILVAMALLLTVQVGALIYSISNKISPFEVLGGVALWGSVPILLLNIVVKSL